MTQQKRNFRLVILSGGLIAMIMWLFHMSYTNSTTTFDSATLYFYKTVNDTLRANDNLRAMEQSNDSIWAMEQSNDNLRDLEQSNDNLRAMEQPNQHQDNESCSPHRSVSYIKIHKTGSGAMHNLLIQLALSYNLTAALPKARAMFPKLAQRKSIFNKAPLVDYSHYNVFFDHARYDKASQVKYMADDVRFVTQIRSPFSQAESAFHHFKLDQLCNLENETSPLTTFLNSGRIEFTPESKRLKGFPVTRNLQAFTLGYNCSTGNRSDFKSYLMQTLDRELFFVSLLEYSDESSVLLRRKMCWNIRDVLTLHTHKTKINKVTETTSTSQLNAKEQAMHIHKQLSALDYMLYEHFKKKLLMMIKQQGADFQEEVSIYKALKARFSRLCTTMCEDFAMLTNRNVASLRRLLYEGGEDIEATQFYSEFRLTYVDCLMQTSPELYIDTVLLLRQYPSLCENKEELRTSRINRRSCDFNNHIYPGYHIDQFKKVVLDTEICLGNYYLLAKNLKDW